jgi:hypothetical protein
MSRLTKIFNKSKVWHKRGKHAKIDPRLLRGASRPRQDTTAASVRELLDRKER